MANTVKDKTPSDILLAVMLEVGGLAIVTAVAGISDAMENLMLVFLVGITILWLFTHAGAFQGLLNSINRAEKAAE
jgi:hypothetical protein